MSPLLMGGLGTQEVILILIVVMLMFGAQKLPELARGSGRALRIFKSEVSALDDTDEVSTGATSGATGDDLEVRQAAERAALKARHDAERRTANDTEPQPGTTHPGR